MKRLRWLPCVLALPVSLALSSGAGDDPTSAFVNPYGPDHGMLRYALEQFGIPREGYATAHLIVAFHRLNGRTFTKEQASRLAEACCSQDTEYELDRPSPLFPPSPVSGRWNAANSWSAARRKVVGAPDVPPFSLYRLTERDSHSYFLNCHPEALVQAEKTLSARIASHGAASPWVRDWVVAQDAVFANCGTFPTAETSYRMQVPLRTLPLRAATNAPQVFHKDSDYQLAAAHFYAGEFGEARVRFQKIGSDPHSPWRQWGAYLAARADIRAASLDPQWMRARAAAYKLRETGARDEALKQIKAQETAANEVALQAINKRLDAVLADSSLKAMHSAATELRNAAHAKLLPEGRLLALGQRFERGDFDGDFTQDFVDLLLLRRVERNRFGAPTPSQGELFEWIRVMQTPTMGDDNQTERLAAFRQSLSRWQASRSGAWLYAVASKLHSSDEAREAADQGVLDALLGSIQGERAFAFGYHAARMTRLLSRNDEARTLLDGLLARPELADEVSARNALLAERFALSRDYDEFVRFLIRVPYGEIDRDLGESRRKPGDPRIGDDAAVVMNMQLPLTVWQRLAKDGRLPEAIRRRIASAGWLRSVLLGRERDADVFTKHLRGVATDLDEELALYVRSPRGAAKQRAAMRIIERRSYIRPYVASDAFAREDEAGRWRLPASDEFVTASWWCRLKPDGDRWSWGEPSAFDSSYDTPVSFLSAAERSAVALEQRALRGLPNATDYYVMHVLAWAKVKPHDSSLPRMLHVAVRSTRGGCISQDTGTLSYRAFRLLQTKYGASDWAKKTPYWYGTTR